jgi:hypothetical protein
VTPGNKVTSLTEVIVSLSKKEEIISSYSDHVLCCPTDSDPYRPVPMCPQSGTMSSVMVGDDALLIARGDNNCHGSPGFYAGFFLPKNSGNIHWSLFVIIHVISTRH